MRHTPVKNLIHYLLLVLVALAYAAAVSVAVRHAMRSADQLGCNGPHIVEAWGINVLGMLGALVIVPSADRFVQRVMRAFLPQRTESFRQRMAQSTAIIFLVGNALAGLVWTSSRLDLFVDAHRPLMTEADVLVFSMGWLGGVSWRVIWPRWAWFGVAISLVMTYFILSNTLSRHAWC